MTGGASWSTPCMRTSSTTPITCSQGLFENCRTRFPIAAEAEPHDSRAKLSDTMTTGRKPKRSSQVKSRPASSACASRAEITRRDIIEQPDRRLAARIMLSLNAMMSQFGSMFSMGTRAGKTH